MLWIAIIYLAGFVAMLFALTAIASPRLVDEGWWQEWSEWSLSLRELLIGSALWFLTLPLGLVVAYRAAKEINDAEV